MRSGPARPSAATAVTGIRRLVRVRFMVLPLARTGEPPPRATAPIPVTRAARAIGSAGGWPAGGRMASWTAPRSAVSPTPTTPSRPRWHLPWSAGCWRGWTHATGGHVVDLGCGAGAWLLELLETPPDLTAVGVDTTLHPEQRDSRRGARGRRPAHLGRGGRRHLAGARPGTRRGHLRRREPRVRRASRHARRHAAPPAPRRTRPARGRDLGAAALGRRAGGARRRNPSDFPSLRPARGHVRASTGSRWATRTSAAPGVGRLRVVVDRLARRMGTARRA